MSNEMWLTKTMRERTKNRMTLIMYMNTRVADDIGNKLEQYSTQMAKRNSPTNTPIYMV